jgi:hypothetical protein
MSELALRPRSATELIDAAFQVYRRSPAPFMVAMALIYIPWLAIQLIFSINLPQSPDQFNAGTGRLIAISGVASIFIVALVGGVVSVLARAAYLDEPIDLGAAFKQTLSRLVQLVVATILEFVLIAIGAVFLFVPAFYLLARFFALRQAIVLEDAGTFSAFGRSGALSRGQKMHILGTLILVALLMVVVDGGAAMFIGLQPSKVASVVLMTAVTIVVAPLFGITETVLYFDTRIRSEGFDVEYLANAPADRTAPTGLTA